MPDLSLATQRLIRHHQEIFIASQTKDAKSVPIHVDEIASKVAAFYENVRKVVDWKEEHLMRRLAMERILKRRLFLAKNFANAAEPFILELIRAGHFPNDEIETSKIAKVQKIINKYTFILEHSPPPPKDRIRSQLYTQMLGIAACEVEEMLAPASHKKINALIEYMEYIINQRIRFGRKAKRTVKETSDEDKRTQAYVAVQEALFKLDSPIITYNLLKRKFSGWSDLSAADLEDVAKNIYLILGEIEKTLSHPLAPKFYKICERYDTPFLLLGDVIAEDPMGAPEKLSTQESFERAIKTVYNRRLKTLKGRTRRAALYSTISVFFSNLLSLYLLEIPLALMISGRFTFLAQVVDIVDSTIVMGLLVLTIKLPKDDNLKLVIAEAAKNVYNEEQKDAYEVEVYPKRGFIFKMINKLLYLVGFCLSFGAIIWIDIQADFPITSHFLAVISIALVVYLGMQIRQRARELHVTEEKDTILNVILEPFIMPVVYSGKRISSWWRKYNILTVLLNLLIDTPLLTFVDFLEQWRYFLKEKKEKIH